MPTHQTKPQYVDVVQWQEVGNPPAGVTLATPRVGFIKTAHGTAAISLLDYLVTDCRGAKVVLCPEAFHLLYEALP